MNDKDVKVEVYKQKDNVLYMKLTADEISIAGITVQPSPKYDGLWVRWPSYRGRDGRSHSYIEIDSKSRRDELRSHLEQVYYEALGKNSGSQDILPTEDEVDNFDAEKTFSEVDSL